MFILVMETENVGQVLLNNGEKTRQDILKENRERSELFQLLTGYGSNKSLIV